MSARLARCPHRQARRAVERWHYSRRMPAALIGRYGVYEAGRFVGVVLFGHGANPSLATPFGLARDQVAELVRVALVGGRMTPTSLVVASGLRRLHAEQPALRLVVSYADPAHGHVGTLYQAGNWIYLGRTLPGRTVWVHGQPFHPRSLYQRYGTSSLHWLRRFVDPEASATQEPPKHKYVYPLDSAMRRRLRRMARPYPRAVKESQAIRPLSKRKGHVRSVLTAPRSLTIPQRNPRCLLRKGRR
jgi:hypothetical protein